MAEFSCHFAESDHQHVSQDTEMIAVFSGGEESSSLYLTKDLPRSEKLTSDSYK